jgi:hypothetical protein
MELSANTKLLEIADRFTVLDVGTKCSKHVDQRVDGGDILGVSRATDAAPVFLDQSVGAGDVMGRLLNRQPGASIATQLWVMYSRMAVASMVTSAT